MVKASSPQTLESAGEIEEGSRLVKQDLWYLAIGVISVLAVTILERLAAGLQSHILWTEIYSIHGFSHVFFGIGLASIILFLRPRSTARVVIELWGPSIPEIRPWTQCGRM